MGLRVVWPTSAPADHPSAWTLREFFSRWYVPRRLRERRARTLEAFLGTISWWEKLTRNPPLTEVTDELCQEWVAALPEKLRPATRNKHARHLRILLAAAGSGYCARGRNACVLPEVPFVPLPEVPPPSTRPYFSREEVGLLLAACARPLTPELPGGPAFWRRLLLAAWNTGNRSWGTLLAWRWEWLSTEESGCPWSGPDQPVWMVIPPRTGKQRSQHSVYLNSVVRRELWPVRSDTGLVFPWPSDRNRFYAAVRQIEEAAGLPPDRRLVFKGMRRAIATRVEAWAGSEMAQRVLGHARTVAHAYYVHDHAVVPWLEKYAAEWQPIVPVSGPTQLSLF
jgi:integrase